MKIEIKVGEGRGGARKITLDQAQAERLLTVLKDTMYYGRSAQKIPGVEVVRL